MVTCCVELCDGKSDILGKLVLLAGKASRFMWKAQKAKPCLLNWLDSPGTDAHVNSSGLVGKIGPAFKYTCNAPAYARLAAGQFSTISCTCHRRCSSSRKQFCKAATSPAASGFWALPKRLLLLMGANLSNGFSYASLAVSWQSKAQCWL